MGDDIRECDALELDRLRADRDRLRDLLERSLARCIDHADTCCREWCGGCQSQHRTELEIAEALAPRPPCGERSGLDTVFGTIDDMRRVCAEAIGVTFDDTTPGLDACVYVVCAHLRTEKQARAKAEAKAEQFEKDWMAAKHEFFMDMGKMRNARDAAQSWEWKCEASQHEAQYQKDRADAAMAALKEMRAADAGSMNDPGYKRLEAARAAADSIIKGEK